MSIIDALYLVLLAAVTGYVLMARVPSLLHTPMLSGSNFIHGIVLAGAMLALSNASGIMEMAIGFLAVMAASANVVGGFIVTDRMLHLFERKQMRKTVAAKSTATLESSGDAAGESRERDPERTPERGDGADSPTSDSLIDRRKGPKERASDHG